MATSIYPCIWCNNNASEMAAFYAGTFSGTRVIEENPLVVMAAIGGQRIMLLNGGDNFRPNPTISLIYLTASAEEVSAIYARLAEGGSVLMPLGTYPFSENYAWVQDRFGVSWQLYTGKPEHIYQTVVPTLMFTGNNNGRAREAVVLYTGIFPDSAERGLLAYGPGSNEPEANIQHGEFLLNRYLLGIMDSSYAPGTGFSEGMSLVVVCHTQDEIDRYWNALTANGGSESMCGWLKDRFGVSWQIEPANIYELLANSPEAMEAMLKMKKIDIATLEKAGRKSLLRWSSYAGQYLL